MKNEILPLSNDINVITTEINSYKQIAGNAIFEIGYRLKCVRDTPDKYGFESYRDWDRWCNEELDMSRRYANQFIKVYEELGNSGSRNLSVKALYHIATLPPEQREQPHTIPSTGETKTVDEMTVRELQEVKKALKEEEARRELAEKEADILRDTLESIEDMPPKVEYVEITNKDVEAKLEKYEELFGDVSMYEGKATRVTNGDAITYSVFEFSEDIRKFVEKYGHLTHFAREFNEMIGEGKAEYQHAIQSMFSLLKSIERNLEESEVIIINQ